MKQAAKEEEVIIEGFNPSTEISMLQIWFEIQSKWNGQSDGYTKQKESYLFNSGDINATKSGNAIIISCSKLDRYFGTDIDVSVSLKVNYNSDGWGNISDIKLDAKYNNQEYGTSWQHLLSATNVNKSRGDLTTMAWWSAKEEEEGLKIISYSRSDYSYISDPSNEITVAIDWRK